MLSRKRPVENCLPKASGERIVAAAKTRRSQANVSVRIGRRQQICHLAALVAPLGKRARSAFTSMVISHRLRTKPTFDM
jgi:hypothetical protein